MKKPRSLKNEILFLKKQKKWKQKTGSFLL